MKKIALFLMLITFLFNVGCNSVKETKNDVYADVTANNDQVINLENEDSEEKVEFDSYQYTPLQIDEITGEVNMFDGINKNNIFAVTVEEAKAYLEDINMEYNVNDLNTMGNGTSIVILGMRIGIDSENNNILYDIRSESIDLETSFGLVIGDSFQAMKNIYGDNYTVYTTDKILVCEYEFEDHYFYVSYYVHDENQEIIYWGISKYTFDTFLDSCVISDQAIFIVNPNYIDLSLLNGDTLINEFEDNNGVFYLGISLEEVCTWFDEKNIENDYVDLDTSEPSRKMFSTEEFTMFTNKAREIETIYVNKNISTTLGLSIGHTFNEMVNLYGENYTCIELENSTLYQYQINDHYFKVIIENNKITMWGISGI